MFMTDVFLERVFCTVAANVTIIQPQATHQPSSAPIFFCLSIVDCVPSSDSFNLLRDLSVVFCHSTLPICPGDSKLSNLHEIPLKIARRSFHTTGTRKNFINFRLHEDPNILKSLLINKSTL
jgi:hypothetical protein